MGEIIKFHSVSPPPGSSLKLKSRVGTLPGSIGANFGHQPAGIFPLVRQLLTAVSRKPSNCAALCVPPSASMNSSTDLNIPLSNPRNMEKSSIHKTDIANVENVRRAMEMGTRDEIMARLRQLPKLLGKADHEIAETCGITPKAWSNYKSEAASENLIRPFVALELWNAYGIPMEWVYDGQTSRVSDPELRVRLTKANHEAQAWLASRRYPRRRGPSARIALFMLAGSFLLVACAEAGTVWKRVDGSPIAFEQVQADKLACKGEAAKANLSAGREAALAPELLGYSGGMRTVYTGCMAEKGYLRERP